MEQLDYFFVNKTSLSDNLSRSDAGEKRSMGAYIRDRRARAQQILSHRFETKTQSQRTSINEDQMTKTKLELDQMEPAFENVERGLQLHPCNTIPFTDINAVNLSHCQIESIWTFEPSGFVAAPSQPMNISINSYAYDLLSYFVRRYEPSTRHVEALVLWNGQCSSEFRPTMMCVHDIICNQMETDALLAAMGARLQDLECIDQDGRDLMYSNRAMSAIAKSVAGTIDHAPRVFRAIFFLMVAAWHHQNTKALQTHLKGLKAILDSIGGLEALNVAIKTILMRFDGMTSAVRFERPCFTSKHLEISDEDQTWLSDKVSSSEIDLDLAIGQKLVHGEHQRIYGFALRSLLRSLVEYVRIIEWQSVLSDPCPRLVHLVCYKLDLLRHRLLELEVTSAEQRIICMSVLIWMGMVLTSEGTGRSVQLMVVGLRDVLAGENGDQWCAYEQLYFWVVSVGVMAAETDSPMQLYFISEIKKLLGDAKDIGFKSQEDLIHFLRTFIYLPCAQAKLIQKLAKHVVV